MRYFLFYYFQLQQKKIIKKKKHREFKSREDDKHYTKGSLAYNHTLSSDQVQASFMQNFKTKCIARCKDIHCIFSSSAKHTPTILKTGMIV